MIAAARRFCSRTWKGFDTEFHDLETPVELHRLAMPLLSSGRNSSELVKKWAKHNWSLAGLLFVYIACFLTESEEHEIVDHLSTWWITIKDRQQAAESGLAAFLAGKAEPSIRWEGAWHPAVSAGPAGDPALS